MRFVRYVNKEYCHCKIGVADAMNGQQCYDYLRNHSKRRTGGKSSYDKKKIDVVNVWVDDNPDVTETLLANFRREEDLAEDATVSVDRQRHIFCDYFWDLDKSIIAACQAKATALRLAQQSNKALQGDKRLE
jgi:hypothetical protein